MAQPRAADSQIQNAGQKAYDQFRRDYTHKVEKKAGNYALLGSWIPVLGTLGGLFIGAVKDSSATASIRHKAEAARAMAEYFAAKEQGVADETLAQYKGKFESAHAKAVTSDQKSATPWGSLLGGIEVSPRHREAIMQAGQEARQADLSQGKKPFLTSKSVPYALIGTLIFPLIGTVLGAVIGRSYDSSSMIRRKQGAELAAASARVSKAQELGYQGDALADFVRDEKRSEILYKNEYHRTSAASWGTAIGAVMLWFVGAAIGAWVGKYLDKEHNIQAKEQADFEAKRAAQAVPQEKSGAETTKGAGVAKPEVAVDTGPEVGSTVSHATTTAAVSEKEQEVQIG